MTQTSHFVTCLSSRSLLFVSILSLLVGGALNEKVAQATSQVAEFNLFSGQPKVYPNPNARAPLVAIVEFQTTEKCTGFVEISDGTRIWQQKLTGNSKSHRMAILGLAPDHSHQIVVKVQSIDGERKQISQPLRFVTPKLPTDFPPVRTTLALGELMEPGITLFAVNNWKRNVSLVDYGYLIALDNTGRVIWYCRTGDRTSDFRFLRNGNLLYQHGSYRYLCEIDLLGNDHRCWYAARSTTAPNDQAIAVDVDTLHHEVVELPNGNFLSLATELRRFEQYPTSETEPHAPWAPAWVVCDEVVEFNPSTGEVKQRLPLTDLLDTHRFGYLALGGFWRDKYDDYLDSPARDWSHANAVQFLPQDNSVLVSLRHLDCVIKIDWTRKSVRWILGNPKNWSTPFQPYLLQPAGSLDWFYHQHAAHIASNGTLLMFDNGNYRAVPYDTRVMAPDNFSRVVAYRIDEGSMTAEQVFEYGTHTTQFYSPFFGEAELLPTTGNLLVTDGGRIETEEGVPFDEVPGQRQWARIFEITSGPSPQKVFEMICESPKGSGWGWSIYRSNRYHNLTSQFKVDLPQGPLNSKVFERKAIVKINPLISCQPRVVEK